VFQVTWAETDIILRNYYPHHSVGRVTLLHSSDKYYYTTVI